MVHTISVSRDGRVKLERVDVAHESGFGLVNPLSVKKQIEGQITWFYNDAMHQACNIEDGRIVENNFDTFSLSRIDEDPLTINIQFFETATGSSAWATIAARRCKPRSPTRSFRSRASAFATCRFASTT